MTMPAQPVRDDDHDAWGNAYLERPGLLGQYTMRSQWGDGRTVYVCGQPEQHVRQGYWRLDGRMEHGQGYLCALCWTLEAGLYAGTRE